MIKSLEEYAKKTKVIYVNDGDNISVIVKLPPSIADPAHLYPAMANVFRVVAGGPTQPKLDLVPLQSVPVLLTEIREEN